LRFGIRLAERPCAGWFNPRSMRPDLPRPALPWGPEITEAETHLGLRLRLT
jgi:hypothetical protein